MIKLSIIIPLYNAEKYIVRCLTSCVQQDIPNDKYEIIVIDDGSKDGSLPLVLNFSKDYQQIKVFSQKNQGAGMARNYGMKCASGEYIMFLDSDDFIYENSLGSVLQIAKNNHLEVCNYVLDLYSKGKRLRQGVQHFEFNKTISGSDVLQSENFTPSSCCTALFSNIFLRNNQLKFTKQSNMEDSRFMIEVYAYAKKIMFTNIVVYKYELHENSRDHNKTIEGICERQLNLLENAYTLKCICDFEHISQTAKVVIKKRVNSIVMSSFLALLSDKRIPFSQVKATYTKGKSYGLIPLQGESLSKKSFFLNYVINIKLFFYILFALKFLR